MPLVARYLGGTWHESCCTRRPEHKRVSAVTVLLTTFLTILLVAALPTWPYSRDWGLGRAGAVGTLLVVLLAAAAFGRI